MIQPFIEAFGYCNDLVKVMFMRTQFKELISICFPKLKDIDLISKLITVYDLETKTFQIGQRSLTFTPQHVNQMLGLRVEGSITKLVDGNHGITMARQIVQEYGSIILRGPKDQSIIR